MSAATVLREAADFLAVNRWGRAADLEDSDCYCALIAIHRCSDRDDAVAAVRAFRQFTGRTSIALWNDEPGRTKDEVVAAMRAAADASGRVAS